MNPPSSSRARRFPKIIGLFLCAVLTAACVVAIESHSSRDTAYAIVLFFLFASLVSNLIARCILFYLAPPSRHA